MMPRLYDERVGYFTVRQTDYGQDEQRAPQRRYIVALAAREERPECCPLRAGEADRLLCGSGNADQMGPVHQAWYREVAGGF